MVNLGRERHDGSMATYDGPATVIAGGAEYEVQALLRSTADEVRVPGGGRMRGLTEWGGTLEASDEGAAWNIHQEDMATLRAEDGREGQFIVTNTEIGAATLEIKGSGRPPFGA